MAGDIYALSPEMSRYRAILVQVLDSEIGFQSVQDVRAYILAALQELES